MSLFESFTPRVDGIAVPPGDPDALAASGRDFGGLAERGAAQSARLKSLQGSLDGGLWFGLAALAWRGAVAGAASEIGSSESAFRQTAGALMAYASELRAAQELARRAQAAGADLNQRSGALDGRYAAVSNAESKPGFDGPSALPGLLAVAGGLQVEAFGIRAKAAEAHQMAERAGERAARAFQEVQQSAPSVQRALRQQREAEEAARREAEEEPGGFVGVLHDVGDGFAWVGGKAADVGTGAWHGVRDPVVQIYHLTPFHDGWTEQWGNLKDGLWHGITHPVDFGKAIIGVDVWQEEGFAYWAGNLLPGAVAAFFTGGGAAAVKGTSSTMRAADKIGDVADTANDLSKVAGASRAINSADDLGDLTRSADEVAELKRLGRTDLNEDFDTDLQSFVPGKVDRFTGELREDLVLVQYYNPDNPSSSLKWWTSTDEANNFSSPDDVRDGLALPKEWDRNRATGEFGERRGVRVIRVPEGTKVDFLHGFAEEQFDRASGLMRPGGGEQFRFRDFDSRWIVDDRSIP